MHYATLVTVEIEHGLEDKEREIQAETLIEELEQQKKHSDSIMLEIYQSEVRMRSTAFSNEVANKVGETMAPYFCDTNNPAYLEFVDMTEDYQREYENDTVNLVKFPNGTILPETHYEVFDKYEIIDGILYEREWGPLYHRKRTKQCKKMQVIRNASYSDLYKTLGEYVEEEHGTPYVEERNAYGYYYNPNAFFDWYSIGGRWPDMFLVKDDCKEYGLADRSGIYCRDRTEKVPEGYHWTCAARKKDIEWQTMYEWELEQAKRGFAQISGWFESGAVPKNSGLHIEENGISRFGKLLYQKGETEDEYLKGYVTLKRKKYPLNVCAFLMEGDWTRADRLILDDEDSRLEDNPEWEDDLEQFIEELDDEIVLVSVDCHM